MRLLDTSFDSPAENLAFDEVLLNSVEDGNGHETLRFWESPVPFVVLGVGQSFRQEVRDRACLADGIPVLRRCSAGGCVLQGPGCLNFSLVLSRENHPQLQTIRGSYCYILGLIGEAIETLGVRARHKGTCDLAVRGKKVSGNAQKRRRHSILHHGTLVYAVDVSLMTKYLREPVDRPQYRGQRTHRGFVRSLPLDPADLRNAIAHAFGARGKPRPPRARELREMRRLAREKYESLTWIRRR